VVRGFINGYGGAAAVMASNAAYSSTALRGAATAAMATPEAVINGKFFSCPDSLEAVKEDFPADFAHSEIRITAMIDELGAASSH
jgi:hypothetical protein